jgi:ATP-binding cassette, subfamily B, bacterial
MTLAPSGPATTPRPDDDTLAIETAEPGWVRRMWPFLRPHWPDLALVFGAALASTAITASLPLVTRTIVDDAIMSPTRSIGPLLVIVAVLGVVRFAISFLRRWGAGRVGINLEFDLRNAIYDHLHRLDFARHDEMQAGQLVSRANTDVRIVQGLFGFLPALSGTFVLFFLSLGVMLTLSPVLTVIALTMIPLLLALAIRMRRVVYPSSWDAQQRAAEMTTVVEEATSGVRVVKGFGQEERELDRLTERAISLFGARMRNTRLSAKRQATMQVIPSLGQAGILALGGWLVLNDGLTLGTFLAFQQYLIQLVGPARTVSGMLIMAQNARAGAERIFELLDSTPDVEEHPDAIELGSAHGRVEFHDVSFGYLRSEPVVSRFDLEIAPGETVALVGASGSGKSTVSLLLPRFYDVQEGRITLDGHDIRDLTLDSLRRQIGVVFEDSFLFSDTVAANITLGRPDATRLDIEAAARAAEAHEFISALPDGYDTTVGERGLTLSGGQRQRLALARALLTDPRVLILDDATSSIDVRLEEEIHRTLQRIMAGRTTLLIAHRRSTLKLAQRIVVVDEGRVVDTGTEAELLERCALFRSLLAGPDADIDTVVPEPDDSLDGDTPPDPTVTVATTTASAWRPPADDDTTIEAARRAAYAGVRQAVTGGGGGGRYGGMGMGMGAARLAAPPTPELMQAIEALPPVRDEPTVDLDAERQPHRSFGFLEFVRPQRRAIAIALVLVTFDALSMLAGPYIIRLGVDYGIIRQDQRALFFYAAIFLGAVAVHRVIAWVVAVYTGRIGQHMLLRLRIRIFAHLQRLGLDFYDREMVGRVMTRMTSDIEALQSLLQTGLIQALVQAVTFIGVIVIMFTMNPQLGLVMLMVVPPLVVATLVFRQRSGRAYDQVRERISAVNANFQESISGVRVTQAFAQEQRTIGRFREVASQHRSARMEGNLVSSTFFPFVELMSVAATILVFWVGAGLITRGSLTPGELIAFTLYITTVFAPIQQLSQVLDSYQQGKAAAKKLGELLAVPVSTPVRPDAVAPSGLRGEIEFDRVTFRYARATDDALRDVSVSIAAGQTVALVGETGAGKSTLVKLVARLYDPTDGRVLVDGQPLTDLDLGAYRRRLGFVPQEAFLFTGTIRDNIAYARPEATDAEVEAAARAVGAHDFIARLPHGYHQPVIERGRSLSSGQRQLIALARAQLVDPVILLLDEATANLDLATEARVAQAMGVVSAGRTTLVIAHRLQSAATADRILVFDHGELVEDGSHHELVRAGGRYAEMWSTYLGDPSEPTPARDR